MRHILFTLVAFFTVTFGPAAVFAQEKMTVDLARDSVDITTGFTGGTVILFGVRRPGGEIAIVLRGPQKAMTVRHKSSILGAWVNRHAVTFEKVPSFYAYSISTDEDAIAPVETMKQAGIGQAALDFKGRGRITPEESRIFNEALIRNKRMQGLFPEGPSPISFLNNSFFRTEFYIPSNVPIGEYEIQASYIENGRITETQIKPLHVGQIGMSARIHALSDNRSIFYALICITLAIFAGWISNRIGTRT